MGQYGSAGLTSWCPRVSPGDGVSRVWTVCGAGPGEQNSRRVPGGRERRRGGGPGRLTAGPALVAQDGSVGDSQTVSRLWAGRGAVTNNSSAGTSPACLPSSGWFSYSNTRLRLTPGTLIWQQDWQAKGTIIDKLIFQWTLLK